MTDPDIILYLYPNDGLGNEGASFAISMPQNERRFVPPRPRRSNALEPGGAPSRQDRESTEQPEEHGGLEDSPCIVLRFSYGARCRLGIVTGCAANVDLALQKVPGISRFHLAFTFDDQNRPIARDLGSLCGTRVVYDGDEGERRSKFDWLLEGPGILRDKLPVLNVTRGVQFRVLVPPRDITSQDYIDRVTAFRQGTADPEDLFATLILRSGAGTQLPSGTHTPSRRSGPILFKKKLGEGSFGVVNYTWNVTTGEECALKEPLPKAINSGQVRIKDWKTQAKIMERVSHEHIVAFLVATFSPWPQLTFEYVPRGSLDACDNLSTFENAQVLRQLLSALRYLHAREPPVGHRDIKPENILVLHRRPSGIHVKFADFGLAKAADYLKTCCGSLLWAAPEIYNKVLDPRAATNERYSVAVDIWSLGLVVASRECGLPEYKQPYRSSAVAWIRAVLMHVRKYADRGNELISFLLDTMLVVDPQERKEAAYCHYGTLRLTNCDSRHPFLHSISNYHLDGSTACSDDTDESEGEEDSGPSTPTTRSVFGGQPSSVHQAPDNDESTIRLPQIPARTTHAASLNACLITALGYRGTDLIDSIVNSTDSGTYHERSDAPRPDTQRSQGPGSCVVPPQGTMLDGELWDLKSVGSLVDDHAAATDAGNRQTDARLEGLDAPFLGRYHLGGRVEEAGAQRAAEVSEAAVGEPRRKRVWSGDRSPLLPANRSLTDPASAVAAPQASDHHIAGRDVSPTIKLRPTKRSKKVTVNKDLISNEGGTVDKMFITSE